MFKISHLETRFLSIESENNKMIKLKYDFMWGGTCGDSYGVLEYMNVKIT